MKLINKVMLYSAAIFPGSGLWFLNMRALAILFMLPSVLALAVIVKEVWALAYQLSNQLAEQIVMTGTIKIDVFELLGLVNEGIMANPTLHNAKWVFIAVWVLGMLVGLRHDKMTRR